MSEDSGTPLPRKLGIGSGHLVTLLQAPEGFEKTLAPLPAGTTVRRGLAGPQSSHVMVLFSADRKQLERAFPPAARRLDSAGGLWVAWPKRASGIRTDLTEDAVRAVGLTAGLVDNKVCAIDRVWSGLRFVYRRKDRAEAEREGRHPTRMARPPRRRP